MALMGASAWHRRAVAVASLYSYRWVRIHSGTFVGDVPRRRGRVHLHRTLCIAFAPGMPADAPGALLAAREDAATRRIPEAAAGACPFGGTGVVWRRALPRDESFLPFGADAAGWLPSNVLATLGLPAWETTGPPDGADVDWIDRDGLPAAALATAPPLIRCTSFLGHNAASFYRSLFALAARCTGLPLVWVDPWFAAAPFEQLTADDAVDVAFMCGAAFAAGAFLPLTQARPVTATTATVLAAPRRARSRFAPATAREAGAAGAMALPAYQSVLVARRGFAATRGGAGVEALRGARFAANERRSWSGFQALRSFLDDNAAAAAAAGSPSGLEAFFGAVVWTGSHKASLAALAQPADAPGAADCATVDSVVLDMHLDQLGVAAAADAGLDVVGGPFTDTLWPMPPAVASSRLSPWVHGALCRALTTAHEDAEGAALLRDAGFASLDRTTAAPYRAFASLLPPAEMA